MLSHVLEYRSCICYNKAERSIQGSRLQGSGNGAFVLLFKNEACSDFVCSVSYEQKYASEVCTMQFMRR
jgi:hypothetical protein